MSPKLEELFQAKYMRESIQPKYQNRGQPFYWYPLVRSIGKSKPPIEMDLIVCERTTGTVVGYEFKYLNYKRPASNYSSLYSGIGQLLSYFTYGIEQGILCIGVSKKVEDAVIKKLIEITATIDNHNKATNSSYLGLVLLHEDRKKFLRFIPVGQSDTLKKFPILNPLIQADHAEILKGNLTRNVKWLNKHGLPLFQQP